MLPAFKIYLSQKECSWLRHYATRTNVVCSIPLRPLECSLDLIICEPVAKIMWEPWHVTETVALHELLQRQLYFKKMGHCSSKLCHYSCAWDSGFSQYCL